VSRTSRYAHALPEAQPVVEGPLETDTAAAPGTAGRVVVVVVGAVVVATDARVVVVTAALVVETAAGSAGVSDDDALVVVDPLRAVVEVVDSPVATVAPVA
jgi:hypothetical protein